MFRLEKLIFESFIYPSRPKFPTLFVAVFFSYLLNSNLKRTTDSFRDAGESFLDDRRGNRRAQLLLRVSQEAGRQFLLRGQRLMHPRQHVAHVPQRVVGVQLDRAGSTACSDRK